jgi:hypothetical protein
MKRFVSWALCSVAFFAVASSGGQSLRNETYSPKIIYGLSTEGSWASPDIIAGLLAKQTVVAVSVDMDIALHQGRRARYSWEFEVLPLYMLGDLRFQQLTIITLPGQTPTVQTYDALVAYPCSDSTYTGPNIVVVNGVATVSGTITSTQTCTRKWTYGGGLSPLGQRWNFRTGRQLQPYALINAGFVLSTEAVPLSDATRFNFTAEGGAGVEVFHSPKGSVAFDIRYHHLSNGGRGVENPGVENWMFRLGYRLGR